MHVDGGYIRIIPDCSDVERCGHIEVACGIIGLGIENNIDLGCAGLDGFGHVGDFDAKGQTLIFACSVDHAEAIAEKIPGAVAVTAKTKNREELIQKFTNREIPVLVNCMIFTEGTDMPLVETVMIARPTSNSSLYTQMVGRGLRLYPGKDKLTLIDLVGTTGRTNLCTAPSTFFLA